MAATSYRYQWNGVEISAITKTLDPSVTPISASATNPLDQIDITLPSADPIAKSDLDAIMLQLGWSYIGLTPGGPVTPLYVSYTNPSSVGLATFDGDTFTQEATVTTLDGTANVPLQTGPIAASGQTDVDLELVGTEITTGNAVRYKMAGSWTRVGAGAPVLIGTIQGTAALVASAGAAGWGTPNLTNVGNTWQIQVTGQVGKTIKWKTLTQWQNNV